MSFKLRCDLNVKLTLKSRCIYKTYVWIS